MTGSGYEIQDVPGETIPPPPSELALLTIEVGALKSEVETLAATVEELTTALNKAVRVAVARG